MELTAEQTQQVAAWIEEGSKLAEIQQKLAEAFDVRLTFMETRFLLDDLKLNLKETAPEEPAKEPELESGVPGPDAFEEDAMQENLGGSGGVVLTVDSITRPGAMVSGRVTFSDGKQAVWYLDQTGRLGLTPEEEGYRPSQPDVVDFQQALQREIAKLGI